MEVGFVVCIAMENVMEEHRTDKKGIRFEGFYRDDIRDGKFTETDSNGNVVAQGYYEKGIRHNN